MKAKNKFQENFIGLPNQVHDELEDLNEKELLADILKTLKNIQGALVETHDKGCGCIYCTEREMEFQA